MHPMNSFYAAALTVISSLALATASFAQSATTNPATNVARTTATLNGTANGGGNTENVTFQIGTDTSYGGTAPTASPSTVTGSTNTAVTGSATGLTPGTLYHYRIVVGSINGSDVTFTTPTVTVTTLAATSITSTSAVLNGTVNAFGTTASNVGFDYGTTTSYSNRATASVNPVTGSTDTAVTATITNLNPSTTYHFRLTGGDGTGADFTFTTTASSGGGGSGGTPTQGGGAGILVYDLKFKHIAGFGIDFFEDGYVVVPATGGDGSVIFLGSENGKRVYTRQEGVKFFPARTRDERYSVITMTGTTGATVSMQAYGKADDKLKAAGKDYVITVKAARTMQGLAQAAYDESKSTTLPTDGTMGFVEFTEMKLSLNTHETNSANEQARTVDSTMDNLEDIAKNQKGYTALELTTTTDTTNDNAQ